MKHKPETAGLPSPYKIQLTEMTCSAKFAEYINIISKDKNIPIGRAEVETKQVEGRNRPDIVIFESPKSRNVLCVIEVKLPFFDVFDSALKDDARKKANERNAKYFATTNFQKLVWWKTKEANDPTLPEEQQIADKFIISELENYEEIDQTRYSEAIKRGIEQFINKLYFVYSGKEAEPKLPVDEFLVFRIQEKISKLSFYYKGIIDNKCHKDTSFAKKVKNWFLEQGWAFSWDPSNFDKAARQTAYLLVNKIVFYNLLQAKRPHEISSLKIDEGVIKGATLHTILQGYFNEVLNIDYETIYTTDFIDTVAFPDSLDVINEITGLINVLKRYDFSKLGYDVIGGIFEQLIPQTERHNLGQYFTNSDIVDVILKFCLQHEDDKIFDPSCGAGTFLVRAYQHKKYMNQFKSHSDILGTLWGNDIAKFPAHLATINLAIRDLGVDKNYPNILQEDFFALLAQLDGFELPERWRKIKAKTLGVQDREVEYPRWFDAIVGNPPYTRQEEIHEIGVDKVKLIEDALKNGNKKIAEISKRAGIHAYFFVHGTKFLKDGGHFGFIVSNSWLDVDYGKGLQEFFLKNYKIVAVIESKVERWFRAADINTCIIILQKCNDKNLRDENLARFVYLKKPLRCFIPTAQDIWENQKERHDSIDKLKKIVLSHSDLYENEDFRIYPKKQKELWDEGFDNEENKYVGAKWGKYLRAPEIFFKILKKGKDKLVPLKDVAKVIRGFTTGANEFFYLTEEEIKKKGIEKEFWMHKDKKGKWTPNYVIKSPRECKSIVVNPNDLKYRVLMIHNDLKKLKGTRILKYIERAVNDGLNKRPTFNGKGDRWYELKQDYYPIIWQVNTRDRFITSFISKDIYLDKMFYSIKPQNRKDIHKILLSLNSTLVRLFLESDSMIMQGQSTLAIYMVQDLLNSLIPNPSQISASYTEQLDKPYKNFSKRSVLSIFDELGANSSKDVSLDKIKPDRRELDRVIMGEVLGLNEEEQLDVYRAVIDLVRSRIEKAGSFGKNGKKDKGVYLHKLKSTIVGTLKERLQEYDVR